VTARPAAARLAAGVVAVALLVATAATATAIPGATVPAQQAPQDGAGAVARMQADVAALAGGGPREAGSAAEQAAAEHVVAVLRGLGRSPSVTTVPLANGRVSRNVETAFGDGPVEILLGAHLDSVGDSPGADDDASGVAVLLELARVLADGRLPVPPRTSVRLVWFGAEEVRAGFGADTHHAGSRQLARSRAAAGRQPHWMVSVDMVGYGATPLAVHLAGTGDDAARVLSAAAGLAGTPAAVTARGDISDHEAFARTGTAAAMLWRPDNPGYHGPADTVVVDEHLLASLRTAEAFVAAAASPFVSGRGMAHTLLAALLARRPDVGGAAHWGARLDAGTVDPGQLGADLLGSAEFASVVAPVVRTYLAAFGRNPDRSGLEHWSGVLRSGAPLEAVSAAFLGSPEFAARHGDPDDRGFVRLLYRQVLGREADAAGEAHWLGELRSGRISRAGLLAAFAESPEHRAATTGSVPVAVAYAGLLGRPPDGAALADWSGREVDDLVRMLVSSEEFRQNTNVG
jgi:hypothetical protein